MAIELGRIQFGDIDAKNEVIKQNRTGSSIFYNSFQVPPSVEIASLLSGGQYFIRGQKGCGKTALLLHIEEILRDRGANTQIILFRTGVGETERAKLANGRSIYTFFNDGKLKPEYDYTTNWLWFIYKNILRLVNPDNVTVGREIIEDLRKLVGVHNETKVSNFSDLAMTKVKGSAKAGLSGGPFSAELSGEVEAAKKESEDRAPIEIIELCERYLPKIRLNSSNRCALFFDELELFWSRPDQRERDLFLIRDLLHSVTRVNNALGANSSSFTVYAAVRSEVLEEVNRVGPELVRDIIDFGASVDWNVRAISEKQPILSIVEAKVHASEIENDYLPTPDIWHTYFPNSIFGRGIRDYMLDISMFKPRHIVSLLNFASSRSKSEIKFTVASFEDTTDGFSASVWREVEEELRGRYSAEHVANLKSILTGFRIRFSLIELEQRISTLGSFDPRVTNGFRSRVEVIDALRVLFRVGAVGNQFFVQGPKGKERRDRWSFREAVEPTIDTTFVVHEALRKTFQLPFDKPNRL
jgi:hypothetical protein